MLGEGGFAGCPGDEAVNTGGCFCWTRRKEPGIGLARGVAAYFAQRRVMRGGGRQGGGEARSAGMVPGAAVEGARLQGGKEAAATGTTPHYTALCECQQARRVTGRWWMPGAAVVRKN